MALTIDIKFLGAAQTVTGSKHILKTEEGITMIDCGLFQGLKELREFNRNELSVDPASINQVLLTHAHLDHCGYLPLLVKRGFKGDIWMSAPTADLARIILRDSAKIQEEDAFHANQQKYTKHEPALPLYTIKDAEAAIDQFKVIDIQHWYNLSKSVKCRFQPNGHILGSCFVEIDIEGKRIVFSGDLGRATDELLRPSLIAERADVLVMETTYGNRLHTIDVSVEDQLATIINDTIHQHGTILIPSFAVGRAQELMHLISQLKKKNKIPEIRTYLDTPMGADATAIFLRYPDWHKLTEKECVEMTEGITITKDFHGTEEIISQHSSKIVISASGMLTGGRVLHYLAAWIGDKKNTVLLVGYQAVGTRGRALENGSNEIKIHGRYHKVNCRVSEVKGLSAHGDQQDLLNWVQGLPTPPKQIFLVHGEADAQEAFRIKLNSVVPSDVIIPKKDELFRVG